MLGEDVDLMEECVIMGTCFVGASLERSSAFFARKFFLRRR